MHWDLCGQQSVPRHELGPVTHRPCFLLHPACRKPSLIACVKADVEAAWGIPHSQQKLSIGGRRLLDPMSLADYRQQAGDGTYHIQVEQEGS